MNTRHVTNPAHPTSFRDPDGLGQTGPVTTEDPARLEGTSGDTLQSSPGDLVSAPVAPAPDLGSSGASDQWLYRALDFDGDLLYVGVTSRGLRRLKEHGTSQEWWGDVTTIEIEHYETRKEVLEAEQRAILEECPKLNEVRPRDRLMATLPRPTHCALCGDPLPGPDRSPWLTHCDPCSDDRILLRSLLSQFQPEMVAYLGRHTADWDESPTTGYPVEATS